MITSKILFCVFGFFEILSNLYHFKKRSKIEIGKSAKRQHQEMPKDMSDIQYFFKAVIMFSFGIVFFLSGILLSLNLSISYMTALTVAIFFSLYSIIQAVIFLKEIRLWAAMIVYSIPFIVLILKL